MKKRLLFFLAFFALILCFGTVSAYAEEGDGEEKVKYKGMANDTVNVREGPGTKFDKVIMEDKSNLQLHPREEIIILDEAAADDGTPWFYLSVTRDGVEYKGYSSSNYVSKLEALPTPTPTPVPPTSTPTPTLEPTEAPTATNPPISGTDTNNANPNDKNSLKTAIIVVILVAMVALIGLLVFKLLGNRKVTGNSTSKKLEMLKKVNLEGSGSNSGRKVPQIKKSDFDRSYREDVKSEVYYRNTADDYYDGNNASMLADSDEKRALREAIDRLQEHDIVYHTIYGEGEVRDNSDVKLIEIRFDNDMRFLKKDQLAAKRELKIVDEEDQSIARRRNRRRNRR